MSDQKPGAVTYDGTKIPFHELPLDALEGLCRVLAYGATKYESGNWRKANDPTRYLGALYRHLNEHLAGRVIDPESGLPHIEHAVTNMVILAYVESKRVRIDPVAQ